MAHHTDSPDIYLFLQSLDLHLLEVELVALLPHSFQQLRDAPVLGVDHLLVGKGKLELWELLKHNVV